MKYFKLYLLMSIIFASSQISMANATTLVMHQAHAVHANVVRPPVRVNYVPAGNTANAAKSESNDFFHSPNTIILNLMAAMKFVLHTLHHLQHLFSQHK